MKKALAAVLLAVLVYAGFRSIGPVPPLGPILDPANGAWASAAATNFPARQAASIPGLHDSVKILFDDRGVPHIFASSELDAYRALGYVQARDRLFQMEAQTRAATGRLTEWAGRKALDLDKESRAVGLAWGAERKLASYDKESAGYKAMDAYADGVNTWISHMRPRDLPIEYRLLNARPIKWEPLHSLYFFSRMSLTLAMNDATMRRLRAQSLVGKTAADALFPVNSVIQQPIQPNGSPKPRFDFAELPPPGAPDRSVAQTVSMHERLLAALNLGKNTETRDAIGSNNWAVAPSRTAGGHAILAGDPHLDLTLPSVWYEMHIVVPGKLDVAGVGFPGVPGVVIGFNRDVAWTFTNTSSDVNDFYAEAVDDATRPSKYRVDGQWRSLEKRVEKYLDQKGGTIATDTLYFTHRGPMRREAGQWLSMRWTAYEKSHELDNFMSLGSTRSVREWLEKMRDYVAPTQNGLAADRSGNIAIRSSGAYPIRPGDGRGDLVRDGSTSASDWLGVLPVEKYPFSMNPAQGFLASANQQPVDPRMNASFMGSDWYSPWRAMRINKLLSENPRITVNDIRLFQTDPGSARADAFVPMILGAAAREDSAGRADAELREAARLLGQWDRRYVRTNQRAVLFEATMRELSRRTWDELMDSDSTGSVDLPEEQTLLGLASLPSSVWWDDRRTAAREDRDGVISQSLKTAYTKLKSEKGAPDSAGWLWSNNRHANIRHLLQLKPFSALEISVQGGPNTLSPSGGRGTQGASWRMVVELGPEVRAWAIYPGGQSGAPASTRYTDRLSRWALGQLDEVLFPRTPDDLARARVVSTLILRSN